MSSDMAEKNTKIVERFISALFETNPPDLSVIDELVDENYIQHNPMVGQGREGIRRFLEGGVVSSVNHLIETVNKRDVLNDPRIELNHVASGDLVVRQDVREGWMLVDIFRVKNGLLVEHWDALRTEPGTVRFPGF